MTRYVDLATDGTAIGRCVVLPGSRYTPDGPMLFFAARSHSPEDGTSARSGGTCPS